MATQYNVQGWSTTPASNQTADSGLGTVAGSVNIANSDDWVRGLMAATRRLAKDTGGALVAGGTANALTVTTNQSLSSGHLTNGLRLAVWATATNTSATVTIAVDGLTAQNIKRMDGSALDVGSIQSGMLLDLVYKTGVGFCAANIAAVPSEFPSGTTSLFFGSTVPTGWVKDTSNFNNHAIRIVTGTPSSGGSSNFSTVFGKTATDNFTLTTGEIPAHSHQERNYAPQAGNDPGLAAGQSGAIQVARLPTTATDGGSGGAHAHNIDLRVKYVDAWRATKS